MSYKYNRHGQWFTVTYESVEKTVSENLRARMERDKTRKKTSFPTTISIKWLSAYVTKSLGIQRNERHWKLHKFVDFALRELAICKDAVIDGEKVDNDNNKWLQHIYLVEGLRPAQTEGEQDLKATKSTDSVTQGLVEPNNPQKTQRNV